MPGGCTGEWRGQSSLAAKVSQPSIFQFGSLVLTEAGSKHRASLHIFKGEESLRSVDAGGIEVFSSDLNSFRAALGAQNHTLKRALTDPRLVSGIGNAYSDEILHAAQMSPILLTNKLTNDEWERLFAATRKTLELWQNRLCAEAEIDFPEKVTAFREGMAVHGRYGEPCPRCGDKVLRIRYADKETNYCARCQTGGKVLADRSLSRLLGSDWPRTLDELEAHQKPLNSLSQPPGDIPDSGPGSQRYRPCPHAGETVSQCQRREPSCKSSSGNVAGPHSSFSSGCGDCVPGVKVGSWPEVASGGIQPVDSDTFDCHEIPKMAANHGVNSSQVVNIELRRLAQRRLPRSVFDYLDGGAEAEVTLNENCRAFRDVLFRPRGAVAVGDCDLKTRVLGHEFSFPAILAPVGYSRLMHPEGEIAAARAAGEAGTGYILSTISGHKLENVKAGVARSGLVPVVSAWRSRSCGRFHRPRSPCRIFRTRDHRGYSGGRNARARSSQRHERTSRVFRVCEDPLSTQHPRSPRLARV